ncbi:MAG: lysophospholipid acyltransferase family protein [Verrucomicrobiota bacterium]|nr:lysophospholipid acyltransferase family protein [Verrucomicrobiota bacterium]
MWPLAALVRLWNSTLRIDISEEDARRFAQTDSPVIFLLWHNRLFVITEVYRRFCPKRRVYGLVSASRDGAWLAAFFSLVGLRAVRGSSSRGGRKAVAELIEVLRAGGDAGITPDGPRGPCYDFKNGGLIVARRTNARILLLGMEFCSAWRLKSWDGFYVPKPFSRVRLRCITAPDEALHEDNACTAALRAQMLALNPDPPAPDFVKRPA